MDSKCIIKEEIKQEEPAEYYLSVSDGELNVPYHSNDEQLAEIAFINVKEEEFSVYKEWDDDELAKHEGYTNIKWDDEKNVSKWQPKHKIHEVFIVEATTRKGPPYTCNICSLKFKTKKCLKAHRSIHRGKRFQCDICSKVYPTKSHIHAHMKIHRKHQFCCPICTRTYALRKSFINHQSTHEEKKFQCDICSKLFRQKGQVADHMKTHCERAKDFKCKICVAAYYRQKSLNRHMKLAHSITQRKQYRCPNTICDKSYLTATSFRTHNCVHGKRSTNVQMVNCSICRKDFYNKAELGRHTRRMHDKPNDFTCSECNKTFSYRIYDTYVQHVAQQCGKVMYKCDYCKTALASKSKLFEHFIEKHKIAVSTRNVHSCPCCSKIFLNKGNLTYHLKKYDHRELKCVHCNKTFQSKPGFHLHQRHCLPKKTFDKYSKLVTNANDQKSESHECNICKCYFLTMANLLEHKAMVHLENNFKIKPYNAPIGKYSCSICNQLFTCRSSLSKHKYRLHRSQSKITCETCKAKFRGQELYRKHFEASKCIQSQCLQYQCTVCSKVYKKNVSLRLHFKRVHLFNNQHFDCEICCKSFRQKRSLLEHFKRGDHAKRLQCEFCLKKFQRISGYKTHSMYCQYGRKEKLSAFAHFDCDICGQSYLTKRSMERHFKKGHHR